MKTQHYIADTFPFGRFSNLNVLAFMCSNFPGWQLYGMAVINGSYNFGTVIYDVPVCTVFGRREAPHCVSDDVKKEQLQIDRGLTAAVMFRGSDNASYIRRMTQEEYDSLVVVIYEPSKDDLFYNS